MAAADRTGRNYIELAAATVNPAPHEHHTHAALDGAYRTIHPAAFLASAGYDLLAGPGARAAHPRSPRGARPRSPRNLPGAGRCGGRAGGRSRPPWREAGAAGVRVAAEPDRKRGRPAGVLAQRLCVLPLAPPRPHGRRGRRGARAHPCGLLHRPAWLRRRRGHGAISRSARRGRIAALPLPPRTRRGRTVRIQAFGLSEIPRPTSGAKVKTDPNQIVYLAFTSGTTGRPKGVMHSDNTLLANARAIAADWAIDRDSVVYSLSPLSHNLGFGAMVMALAAGGELLVHDLPRGGEPRRSHRRDRHELPGRGADPCDRPAARARATRPPQPRPR